MTLLDVYDALAAEHGTRTALDFRRAPHEGTTLTWRAVAERSAEIATGLRTRGIGDTTRCALVMADHPELVPTLLALWRRGAVVVPVDPRWGARTLGGVLTHSGAEVVVDAVSGSVTARPVRPHLPVLPDGVAMISYTSGSTADPKGVVLTHGQLLHAYRAGARALADLLGYRPRRFGAAMRMSGLGVLGMNHLWPVVMGIPVVTLPELTLASAPRYWADLRAAQVDLTYLVPPLVELLNRASRDQGAPSGTVTCLSGGAPLSARAQERFQTRFAAILLNVYGLTEVSFAAFFGDRGDDGRATGSIGVPATVEARLRGPDGVVLDGAGEGELELRGPAMSCGYYDNDAATAAVVHDGWLRTGDLARRDAQGRYRITGRRKDVVLKGAFTVYLHEVEEAANAFPGVLESAALRLDTPTGEDVGLIACCAPEVDADIVRAHLVAELGPQRAPRRVAVTADPLPRTGQEKIDRRAALDRWRECVSHHVAIGGGSE